MLKRSPSGGGESFSPAVATPGGDDKQTRTVSRPRAKREGIAGEIIDWRVRQRLVKVCVGIHIIDTIARRVNSQPHNHKQTTPLLPAHGEEPRFSLVVCRLAWYT